MDDAAPIANEGGYAALAIIRGVQVNPERAGCATIILSPLCAKTIEVHRECLLVPSIAAVCLERVRLPPWQHAAVPLIFWSDVTTEGNLGGKSPFSGRDGAFPRV